MTHGHAVEALHALCALRDELEAELRGGILPYWMTRVVDDERGGFVGRVEEDETRVPDAPRGVILNARVLWAFSAACRAVGDVAYRATADRAAAYFRTRFVDLDHGGVHWMVDADGAPLDRRKHVYAQAFAIYALAEHHRATRDRGSLDDAVDLFRLVERRARAAEHGGYEEAFTADWRRLDDVRLGPGDPNERRSMNTHLHLLEAYAGLLRAWPDALLRRRLRELVELFLDRIVDQRTGHVGTFFDARWTPRSTLVSFGHDIETSWLLLDAADLLDDAALRARVRRGAVRLAEAVRDEAVDADGGIFYDARPGRGVDTDKEWWPQAEAIVGFVAAWQETGDDAYLRAARGAWAFTRAHLVDQEHGEWRRRVARDGTPRPGHEKVGPWKCPYHNARACLEIMARADAETRRAARVSGKPA